jgi:hypothetical protein
MTETESGLAVAGSLHLRSAIMAARRKKEQNGEGCGKDGHSEVWGYIEQAREVAERIGRDTNHYGLVFGPTNVKIHEVAIAVELDDPDEAIRRNEGFKPPPSLPVERSSHHYIDLARVQLVAGERKSALDSLITAERLAPQHTRNHPMARETVTGLLRVHKQIPERLRRLARRMGVFAPSS